MSRLFNSYVGWWDRHYTNRRKLIIVALAIITFVAAFAYDTTRADAYATSSLPHGATYRCEPVWFYQECGVVVQPGSTFDIQQRLQQYPSTSSSIISAIVSFAVCGAIAAPAAPFCAAATAYRAEELKNAFSTATSQKRCVRIRWKIVPYVPGPVDVRIGPFGEPQRWLLRRITINGAAWEYYTWGSPTSCQTRNPCVDAPWINAWCIL